jgi:hypothetical protein
VPSVSERGWEYVAFYAPPGRTRPQSVEFQPILVGCPFLTFPSASRGEDRHTPVGKENAVELHHRTRRLQKLAGRAVFVALAGISLAQAVAAASDEPRIARVRSTDPSLAALIDQRQRNQQHFSDWSRQSNVRTAWFK